MPIPPIPTMWIRRTVPISPWRTVFWGVVQCVAQSSVRISAKGHDGPGDVVGRVWTGDLSGGDGHGLEGGRVVQKRRDAAELRVEVGFLEQERGSGLDEGHGRSSSGGRR